MFFFRGEWNLYENLLILDFVKKNGTKWAQLSRILPDRNEHQLKNRFFGLLAKFLDESIKTIKKQRNYLNEGLLTQAENYFRTGLPTN